MCPVIEGISPWKETEFKELLCSVYLGARPHREIEDFTGDAAGPHEEAVLVVHAYQPADAVYVLEGDRGAMGSVSASV